MSSSEPIGNTPDEIKKNPPKLRYAAVANPHIEAIIAQTFRFANEEQAKRRLDFLQTIFFRSKNQLPSESHPSLVLWIKGYEITPEEEQKGCSGNFAVITYKQVDKGKFCLYATKLPQDVKTHPQRKRVKARHPNWGHPILRQIKKRHVFKTADEARNELTRLHEEYPETSIPLVNKLNIMIYSRDAEKGQPPVKKYVLNVKALEEGGFIIDSGEKFDVQKVLQKTEVKGEEPQGYFTKMVEQRRARRKKK